MSSLYVTVSPGVAQVAFPWHGTHRNERQASYNKSLLMSGQMTQNDVKLCQAGVAILTPRPHE